MAHRMRGCQIVLYEEDYVENGQEFRREVTCCMEFERYMRRVGEQDVALRRLVDALGPHPRFQIVMERPEMPWIEFCPICGTKYSAPWRGTYGV